MTHTTHHHHHVRLFMDVKRSHTIQQQDKMRQMTLQRSIPVTMMMINEKKTQPHECSL